MDDETYIIVSDLKLICTRYLKGNFVFDFLAWIPFEIIFMDHPHRLFRLFKLLRVPRLAQLIDVEQAKQIVNDIFNKRLLRDLRNERTVDMQVTNQSHYPIMLALQLVKAYEIIALVIIIFSTSFFFGILWHIFVHDVENWKSRTSYDVYNGYLTFFTYPDYELLWTSHDNDPVSFRSMVKVWYYGLTTLSTIGFGDFSPKSTEEKFIISFAMMLGVTVFSYIMGNLIDILAGYNSLQLKKDTRDLTKWLALLSKFSDG